MHILPTRFGIQTVVNTQQVPFYSPPVRFSESKDPVTSAHPDFNENVDHYSELLKAQRQKIVEAGEQGPDALAKLGLEFRNSGRDVQLIKADQVPENADQEFINGLIARGWQHPPSPTFQIDALAM